MKLTDRQKNVLIYLKCLLLAILTVIGVASTIYGLCILAGKYPVYFIRAMAIIVVIGVVLLISQVFYGSSKKS